MHAPSVRGRKRKQASHALPWDPSHAVRANMPRANPGAATDGKGTQRPYYQLVFGREPEDDVSDALPGAWLLSH